jgi:hypothetical protein
MHRRPTVVRPLAACALFVAALVNARAQTVAYTYPTGIGNQAYGGALGMDFDVNAPIQITALGAFDSGNNGFLNNIDVILYNRDTQASVAAVQFSPSMWGYGLGASCFQNLAAAITLQAGFHGTIVAQGYGILEQNGNSNSSGSYATSLNTGNGAISFVGTSRYGAFGAFPTNPDGSVARYGAGNFRYTAVPEPASLGVILVGLLGILRRNRSARTR